MSSRLPPILFALYALLPNPAVAAGPPVAVGVAPVLSQQLPNTVTLIGSAIPKRLTRVSAQVAGMVTRLSVDRGSEVAEGAELFRLDDAIARIDLQRAEALLAQSIAEVAETDRKYKEAQRLRSDGHVPQTTLDTAATAAAIALARRDEQQALVARASEVLRQHTIRAPFAGTIVTKDAEVGQWIGTNTAVLQLVETNPARVEVPVPQRLFAQLKDGAAATVTFESLPGEAFSAEVGALIPQGLAGARTFPVWLEIANQEGRIAPGMSARVALTIGDAEATALSVPSDALIRRADGTTLVWLVEETAGGNADSALIAKAVRIRVGSTIGDRIQVDGEGLAAGDLVVVRGNENLRPQQPVKVVAGSTGGR